MKDQVRDVTDRPTTDVGGTVLAARKRLRIGSTFTGAGGLDMALRALWPDADLAWFSENDDHAAAVFSHHHPDVPNLGDITTVDWSDVEPVDVLVGGFPCQDISHAGQQAGIKEGTRSGLWFELLHAAVQLRPRLLLLENVAAITSAGGGLDVVLGSLAEVGWDAEWTCLRASDIGAPHGRDRWFAAAWPRVQHPGHGTGGTERRVEPDVPTIGARQPGEDPANPHGAGLEGSGPAEGRGAVPARADSADGLALLPTPNAGGFNDSESVKSFTARQARMKERHGNNGMGTPLNMAVKMLPTPRAGADRASRGALTKDGHWSAPSLAQAVELAEGRLPREYRSWDEIQGNQATSWGEYGPAINRWRSILGRPAPDPTDSEGRLSPRFVEWMMGWPDRWTCVADTSRTQRLKMLGNGVVPHQAVHAYQHLLTAVEVAA